MGAARLRLEAMTNAQRHRIVAMLMILVVPNSPVTVHPACQSSTVLLYETCSITETIRRALRTSTCCVQDRGTHSPMADVISFPIQQ